MKRARVLLLMLLVIAVGTASADPPKVTHLMPAGGQRGTEFVTQLGGEFGWPVNVRAPGVTATVEPGDENKGKVRIAIPADMPADRVWLRVYNAEGASARVPLLVGDLPELVEQEPNNASKEAQKTAIPITVNGVLAERRDVDTISVDVPAGATLIASLDAHDRLGSPMDAILQLLSADGVVISDNHDKQGLDPRIMHTVTTAGTYLVRVFAFPSQPDSTIELRGAKDYVYRLTLTTGPFVTHVRPLSLASADAGTVQPRGWNIPPESRLAVRTLTGGLLADDAELESEAFPGGTTQPGLAWISAAGWAGSTRVRLAPGVPSLVHDEAGEPLRLDIPSAVTGVVGQPRASAAYLLKLTKDQQIEVTVAAQRFGSPLVPAVRILDSGGKVVSEAGRDGERRDATLSLKAPSDGEYRLEVTDRFRRGGPEYFCGVAVRGIDPDFTLTVASDSVVIDGDKPTEIEVSVSRREFRDPIRLHVEGLPEGVTAAEAVTEPPEGNGENSERRGSRRRSGGSETVKLTLVSQGVEYSGPIRIVGTGGAEEAQLHRAARTPERLGATFESIWLTARPIKR